MHGWVGYLDEMMIDRIANHDTTVDAIVELAAAALVTTLRVSTSLDPSIAVTPETLGALDTFSARG
jgi:hypothetical protein